MSNEILRWELVHHVYTSWRIRLRCLRASGLGLKYNNPKNKFTKKKFYLFHHSRKCPFRNFRCQLKKYERKYYKRNPHNSKQSSHSYTAITPRSTLSKKAMYVCTCNDIHLLHHIINIMSCRQHGFSWFFPATCLYRPPRLAEPHFVSVQSCCR